MSDDVEESQRKEREAQKARKARISKDQRMEAASDEIRDSASQRMGKRDEDSERGEERKPKVRLVFVFDEKDADLEMLNKTIRLFLSVASINSVASILTSSVFSCNEKKRRQSKIWRDANKSWRRSDSK